MTVAEEIKEGADAVTKVSDDRVFKTLVAIVAMGLAIMLVVWMRQDARDDRAAFLASLKENSAAVSKLADAVYERHHP